MHRLTENAKITKVTLGRGDHGPDGWIYVEMNGTSQALGGYSLNGRAMTVFVMGVLDALDIKDWSSLVGTYCRVDHDFQRIYRIGHIVKDTWFDPTEAFATLAATK